MTSIKKLIAIVIIISIVIIADIILGNVTKDLVSSTMSLLDNINASLEKEEVEENQIHKLHDEWEKVEKISCCYIDHNEIEKVSVKIGMLKRQIEIEAFSDAKQCLAEIKYQLEHIDEKQDFRLENFF